MFTLIVRVVRSVDVVERVIRDTIRNLNLRCRTAELKVAVIVDGSDGTDDVVYISTAGNTVKLCAENVELVFLNRVLGRIADDVYAPCLQRVCKYSA